jgi:hypothetical protein
MVVQHTQFEYGPADDETRRMERARLTFKPSRELSDKLAEFILPSKRHQVLGRHGLLLYSNFSWNVYRNSDGELEPQAARMEHEFQRIQKEMQASVRKMKLTKFVVFKEIQPPEPDRKPTTLIGLKIGLSPEIARAIYDIDQIPSELLSRDTVPVHIAFPEDIAIPALYNASPRAQLERLVFGNPVSPAEAIGAGESPNANASVTDMKLILKPYSRD